MKDKQIASLMGVKVVVNAIYRRKSVDAVQIGWAKPYQRGCNARDWESLNCTKPRVGWVVGVTNLISGYTQPGSWEDPAVFKEKGRVRALLVCYWPGLKPVPVPFSGFKAATPEDGEPSPEYYKWSEVSRQELSDFMRGMPRDARGRWVKPVYGFNTEKENLPSESVKGK